jgi:hypothetical protein
MRSWTDAARQRYDQIFSTTNLPSKPFRWIKIRKEDAIPGKFITTRFDGQLISLLSDAVNTALKIGLPIGYALGLYVILGYLYSCGAPFLISDFSTIFWFINIAALVAVTAILFIGLIFFVPTFYFSTSSKLLLYTRTIPPTSTLSPQAQSKEFLIQWFSNNGTAFGILCALTILNFTGISDTTVLISAILVFGGIFLAIYLLHKYSRCYKKCPSRARLVLCVRVLGYSSWKALWTAFWAGLLFVMMSKISSFLTPAVIWLTVFTIFMYSLFFVSSRVTGGRRYQVLIFIIPLAFFMIMMNPSYSGRRALQYFRIGGGIHVSILSKTMISDGKDVVGHTIDGCMILYGGNHIIVKVLSHPTFDTCQAELTLSRASNGEISKGIEIISTSDVLKLGAPTS